MSMSAGSHVPKHMYNCSLLERDYLVQRLRLASMYHGLVGRSSNAMVLAAFTGEGPYITDYPLDRADWRRCLLAYALAPQVLREQMRPIMRAYRASLDRKHWRLGSCPFPRTAHLSGRPEVARV